MQIRKGSCKGRAALPRSVRDKISAQPGDKIAYEIEDNVRKLKRLESYDAAFHASLSNTLDEWAAEVDDEAFRDL